MARLLLLASLLPSMTMAQGVVCAVLDAPQVSDAAVRRACRATEGALRQLSSLTIGEGPPFRRNAPRKCDGDCAESLARSVSASGAVLLELKGLDRQGERVGIELQLWLDGERIGSKRGEGTIEGFEAAVRPQLEALLPGWARQGYGGLRLEVEPNATVKVDGRVSDVPPGQVMAVAAGLHQVDVVFPDGHAVLQAVEVTEGGRARVQAVTPAQAVSGTVPKRSGALRATSYVLFMAGAAAIAGGLVAGTLGRNTAADVTSSCQGAMRDCTTLDVVLAKQQQAEAYATTGNVLLGVGSGLAAVGVGLFIIDAATP